MTVSIRFSLLIGVLALFILGSSTLAGVVTVGTQRAAAADESGEESTTTPEEPAPVVETPTEPETTPEPETPVTTPPVTTPPVGAPSGGGTTIETPKSTPSTGSTATGGGTSGGTGGGGGGSTSGGGGGPSPSSSGSSSGGAVSTAPAPITTQRTTRTPTHRSASGGAGGGGSKSTGGGDGGVSGGGGGGNSAGGGHRAASHSGGGPAPQPTVSTRGIDQGASAVSNAASHVGKAFAQALPSAPLKKIGDRLAAHIAGAGRGQGGKAGKATADGIGTALGAALIGSAVAVDAKPAASSSPIPFFTPPGGKSSTVYLILIAALLLAVAALVFREVRKSLGLDAPRTGVRVADEKPQIALRERIGVALAGAQGATDRWFGRFRRLRSNAAAGLRSLF
ncbi:MAG: hypothetical protein AB7V58_02790 [Solirubrobacterales bacterium]